MKVRMSNYENIMERIIKGENLQLSIEFYTSFPMNFTFTNNEVKLVKSSWNANK
jgi:hypothetical protein